MNTDTAAPSPYQTLFIYYLRGRVGGDPLADNENYIGNWQEGEDAFLFFKSPAEPVVRGLLAQQTHLVLQDRFEMTYEEWQGQAVGPFQVGRLNVVPPWYAAGDIDGRSTIVLDPGVVFGNGRHPTTNDCLTAIQMAFDAQPVQTVMDLGTGTGLLALAAARLGAKTVLAIDLNRLAVETARRNVIYNQMAATVLVAQGNAIDFMDISSDLMVSNIHYAVMRQLVAAHGFGRQKQFILSGLLRSQAREIEHQLHRQPVDIIEKWERDGTWYTYYGRGTT